MAENYEIVKKIAVLGGREGGVTKELNLLRWGSWDAMYDIRRWDDGKPKKGISLRPEEAEKLLLALGGALKDEKSEE